MYSGVQIVLLYAVRKTHGVHMDHLSVTYSAWNGTSTFSHTFTEAATSSKPALKEAGQYHLSQSCLFPIIYTFLVKSGAEV